MLHDHASDAPKFLREALHCAFHLKCRTYLQRGPFCAPRVRCIALRRTSKIHELDHIEAQADAVLGDRHLTSVPRASPATGRDGSLECEQAAHESTALHLTENLGFREQVRLDIC